MVQNPATQVNASSEGPPEKLADLFWSADPVPAPIPFPRPAKPSTQAPTPVDIDGAMMARAAELVAAGKPIIIVQGTIATEFPGTRLLPLMDRIRALYEHAKPAGREDATRGRGRPADPKKAGARKHRQSPVIAAYLEGIEAVRVALAGEQSSGLFGPIPPDGRDTKALFLATELLFNCGGHESRYKGYAFPRWKSLAKELNVSRATLARYSAALFAKTKCFVKVKAPNNFLRIYPALDGVPIHPKAPGYDRAKIEAAIAGLPSARNGN